MPSTRVRGRSSTYAATDEIPSRPAQPADSSSERSPTLHRKRSTHDLQAACRGCVARVRHGRIVLAGTAVLGRFCLWRVRCKPAARATTPSAAPRRKPSRHIGPHRQHRARSATQQHARRAVRILGAHRSGARAYPARADDPRTGVAGLLVRHLRPSPQCRLEYSSQASYRSVRHKAAKFACAGLLAALGTPHRAALDPRTTSPRLYKADMGYLWYSSPETLPAEQARRAAEVRALPPACAPRGPVSTCVRQHTRARAKAHRGLHCASASVVL